MLGVTIDPLGPRQRAVLTLMPGLPTRLGLLGNPLELLARLTAPFGPRLRWIARRRQTAIARVAVRLPLELLDPLSQRPVLRHQLRVLRAQLADQRLEILIAGPTRIRACRTHA